jgi:hypothetical protein
MSVLASENEAQYNFQKAQGNTANENGLFSSACQHYRAALALSTSKSDSIYIVGALIECFLRLDSCGKANEWIAVFDNMKSNSAWLNRKKKELSYLCGTSNIFGTSDSCQNVDSIHVDYSKNNVGTCLVGSTMRINWRKKVPIDKNSFEFLVFSMPSEVRLNGTGFFIVPPHSNLPFNYDWNPEELRVVFPLYLPESRSQGHYAIKFLKTGEFAVYWKYFALDLNAYELRGTIWNKTGKIDVSVIEDKPQIIVQEKYSEEKSGFVTTSDHCGYGLQIFTDKFKVYDLRTKLLVFEKMGTAPRFSSTSRFLEYVTHQGTPSPTINIIDILSGEQIYQGESYNEIIWTKDDAFLIVFYPDFGRVDIVDPFRDSIKPYECFSCHACPGSREPFAIDIENGLIWYSEDIYTLLDSVKIFGYNGKNGTFKGPRQVLSAGYPILRASPNTREISHGFSMMPLPVAKIREDTASESSAQALVLSENSTESLLGDGRKIAKGEYFAKHIDRSTAPIDEKLIERLADEKLLVVSKNLRPSGKLSEKKQIITTYKAAFPVLTDNNFFLPELSGNSTENIDYFADCWRWKKKTILCIQELSSSYGNAAGGTSINPIILVKNGDTTSKFSLLEELGENSEYKGLTEDLSVLEYSLAAEKDAKMEMTLSGNGVFLAFAKNEGTLIAYEVLTNKIISVLSDIAEAYDVKSFYITQNKNNILQINTNGKFFIYNVKNHERVLSGVFLDDEYVVYSKEGYYESTAEGAHYVWWYFPGSRVHCSFNQFESKLRRKDIILSILQNKKLEFSPIKFFPPPQIDLTVRQKDNSSGEFLIEMAGSSTIDLSKYLLYIDGIPSEERVVSGLNDLEKFDLRLKRGLHWITGIAYNKVGFTSLPKSVMVNANNLDFTSKKLYLLGIGISNYPNLELKDQLMYSKSDIRKFAKIVSSYCEGNKIEAIIDTLFDQNASERNIESKITQVAAAAEKDNLVILYLSGHGIKDELNQFYFMSSDATLENFRENALRWQKIVELVGSSKSKILVFLDACHSGLTSNDLVVFNAELISRIRQSIKPGIAVVASSKGRQLSFESPSFGEGQSAFNYAICRIFDQNRKEYDLNRNGIIELSELYIGIKKIVHQITGGRQTPWLTMDELMG